MIGAARVVHREVVVDGVRIAYREAGPPDAPTVLLLHGVPSSSRMDDGLIRHLGSQFTLFMQAYGAPVGIRLACARPTSVEAMIFQNGNVYTHARSEPL